MGSEATVNEDAAGGEATVNEDAVAVVDEDAVVDGDAVVNDEAAKGGQVEDEDELKRWRATRVRNREDELVRLRWRY